MPTKAADPDAPLKRLGGGRWQTRDERFTIEPQSGTWVVVDGEQTDELGLPLVRGPFGSLTEAKSAIADARSSEPATSPLAAKVAGHASDDRAEPAERSEGRRPRRLRGKGDAGAAAPAGEEVVPDTDGPEADGAEPMARPERTGAGKGRASGAAGRPSAATPEPTEPKWLRELEPEDRRRARRLLDRLTEDGAKDAEGLVRRDVVGDVAAVAAWAILRAVRDLGEGPDAVGLVRLLADGRDERLGVRWHLVDGDGRRIHLEPDDVA